MKTFEFLWTETDSEGLEKDFCEQIEAESEFEAERIMRRDFPSAFENIEFNFDSDNRGNHFFIDLDGNKILLTEEMMRKMIIDYMMKKMKTAKGYAFNFEVNDIHHRIEIEKFGDE